MFRSFFLLILLSTLTLFNASEATERVVWSMPVKADGTPTPKLELQLGERYQIRVSGTINLGNWTQNGEKLVNDAFYQYNDRTAPTLLPSLKNSMNIPFRDSHYHPDHIYVSNPFMAFQTSLHFWIYDADYNDNTGHLKVEVIKIDQDEIAPGVNK